MADHIVFLTPFGQLLKATQKAKKFDDNRMAEWLKISRMSYRALLITAPEYFRDATLTKVCERLNIVSPPSLPEDVSPLDSLIYKYEDFGELRIPYEYYLALMKRNSPLDMQQFVVSFTNKVSRVIRSKCLDVMAVELWSRATLVTPPSAHMDIFVMHKPLTKLRLSFSVDQDSNFLRFDVFEMSQRDNTLVSHEESGTFNQAAMKRLVSKIVPKFCGNTSTKINSSALDIALSKKSRQAYESNKKRKRATPRLAGRSASSSSAGGEREGEIVVGGGEIIDTQ